VKDLCEVTERTTFVALSLLPSWCWLRTADELRAGGSPAGILDRLLKEHYRDKPDEGAILRRRAAAAVGRAGEQGIAPVCLNDASYPVALAGIVDPPPVLWVRGSVDVLRAQAVAIVGARASSHYGLAVAERLAGDLACAGVAVVSGMARGVDSAAHRGALRASGQTIAVFGTGADVIYPRENDALAQAIVGSGAVVSELVPGTPPLPMFFPLRNRIISGLSRAVVVVEAGEKSGSLITARLALEQGRDVLAVPGNVLTGRNRGAHGLLRDGAKIVESASDILEELGFPDRWCGSDRAACRQPAHGSLRAGDAGEDPVLACLTPGEPSDIDRIAERTGLNPARILVRLSELELEGVVARVGGGRFVRS
jgi:DNA processing protein